ncbi:T9SS type A sorting domain-containing protein [Flavobacterium zepuense]|uniref:T9SS type A sorting domain-containing protein n=1 Tax=Flavobacterium zepuense TaxID=2593302 RepID=A0A552V864_9FLAO|nr:T9SS type A sorting domain-containing protein [Flavobacterium zepuense]TRW26657.1 T9SS type A sorting domain-containing protein [Flavobacterium zepuense]
MKNVMKFGLALAMIFSVAVVRANEGFSVTSKEGMGKVISFTINETNSVHVSIYNADGSVIFDETTKGKDGKISRTYDLNAFPDGTYFLETETGAKVARRTITLTGKSAKVDETAVAEIVKPVVTNKNGLVSVNIANTNNAPVQIKMYDEANNELYSETLKGANVAKKFNINRAGAKNFTLVMTYNNKTFVETIAAR